MLSVVALPFLAASGSNDPSIPAGTIAFGTAGSGCNVVDPEKTITSTMEFEILAHLTRAVRVGETVTGALTFPDGHTQTADQTFDSPGTCIHAKVRNVKPGHYIVEYRSGTEVLARGDLTVAP